MDFKLNMNHYNGISALNQISDLSINDSDHSENYRKLLECGLSTNVANALDAVFKEGNYVMQLLV